MRKLMFALLWTVATSFFIVGCKKQISEESSSDQLVGKIDVWLNQRKAELFDFKKSNIDLLKTNLLYQQMQTKKLKDGRTIIFIPIDNPFKTARVTDKNAIPSLVLTEDTNGAIRNGYVVLYKANGAPGEPLSVQTFMDIFDSPFSVTNGVFQFLSVAGHSGVQLEYENGKLKSRGVFKPQNQSRINSICIDWWLTTTYYLNGVVIDQTIEYVDRTCSNDCYNEMYQSFCPDGEGNGSGSNE